MLKETELRIVKAIEAGVLTRKEIGQAYGLSKRTIERIAKKYGLVKPREQDLRSTVRTS